MYYIYGIILHIWYYITKILAHIKNKLLTFTVGNKNDAPDRKVVLTEDAQRFADQMGIRLFETSAKDNINVEEVCFTNVFWLQCSLVPPEWENFL